MPSNRPPRSIVLFALVCLQLQLYYIHCAPVIDTTGTARATSVAELPPIQFPSDASSRGSNVDVRRIQNALAPDVFPSNESGVLHVSSAPKTGDKTIQLQPCNTTDSDCLFPTVAGKLPIERPSQEAIDGILMNLRNRTLALSAGHNVKNDAVLLEDGPMEAEDAVQPEEQYGSKTNNLMAFNLMTSDDTIVLDRPHETLAEPRSMLMSIMLTVSVLGVCMLLSMLVWRKYVQKTWGLHERLIDEEETMQQP